MIQHIRQRGRADVLRVVLLVLVVLGVAGTAGELALERHWHDWIQLLPWVAVGGVCIGLAALLVRVSNITVWLARMLAVLAIAMAVVGIWQHLAANYDTAPLDGRYTDRWESMSLAERWWEVGRGEVGPAPMLAAGVLLQIGLALGGATIGLRGGAERHRQRRAQQNDAPE